jgi:hypothetical protein
MNQWDGLGRPPFLKGGDSVFGLFDDDGHL